MFQITQIVAVADESGIGIEEVKLDWVMEDHKDQVVLKKTEKLAVRFVEKQEGIKLEEIGEGWYRELGTEAKEGETTTFWQIEEV